MLDVGFIRVFGISYVTKLFFNASNTVDLQTFQPLGTFSGNCTHINIMNMNLDLIVQINVQVL